MKNAIIIEKENYSTLNSYTVKSSNGSRLYRSKCNYEFKDSVFNKTEYAVLGAINGKVVYIDCKNYRAAKQLFMAMQ